ncbi:hypothetical protein C2S52_014407 [Perilla frutescens var. hirtella]|nr:hypothetical protein C2S52_014407 [Perilla frutescens var. hirtella]
MVKRQVQPPFEMPTEISGDQFDYYEAHKATADLQSKDEELDFLAHVGTMDDLYLDIVSPPFQIFGEEIRVFSTVNSQNSNEENSYALPSASLDILRHCRSRISSVNGKRICGLSCEIQENTSSPSQLSTNHIIELSAANFIHSKLRSENELYAISHPHASSLLGLSEENSKDVQLVEDLLSCAEKVSNKNYESASKLLEECYKKSCIQMNKMQRLVCYFTEALREKIDRGSGRSPRKRVVNDAPLDPTAPTSATAAFFEKLPFSQITQFASIQSMVEHVSDCRKVHVIDLELRCGVQQFVLMQALAARSEYECSIDHFKITAVATESRHVIEEAGVRLRSLASSLNISFSFHVITLEDFVNLQLSILDLDNEEAVLVYGLHALEKLVSNPNELEALMRVIRRINPCVMITIDAAANVNSPVFVDRFVEALVYCGALFDSLEDCLRSNVAERGIVESSLLVPVIRNAVAGEGAERKHRIVGINVWRAFFSRFGMVEAKLSKLALNHASMVLSRFECRDSCTLDFNGNSLIVSWKGTPICSLSVWKF